MAVQDRLHSRLNRSLFKFHLFEQVTRAADAVHDEQHIADVHGDIAADRGVERHVRSKLMPINSPEAFSTGDPELPPVVWFVARKQTGTVLCPPIVAAQRPYSFEA